MVRDALVIRVALAAVLGLGFVTPTVSATLSFLGVAESGAVGVGALAGVVAFVWIGLTSERVR